MAKTERRKERKKTCLFLVEQLTVKERAVSTGRRTLIQTDALLDVTEFSLLGLVWPIPAGGVGEETRQTCSATPGGCGWY